MSDKKPREFCIIASQYYYNEHWSVETTEMTNTIQSSIDATMRIKTKDKKYNPIKLKVIEKSAYDDQKEVISELNRAMMGYADLKEKADKLAEALQLIVSEFDRGYNKRCYGCCNGNDIPEEELCRACWRIYFNGTKYLLWSGKQTYPKAKQALAEYRGEEA